MGGIAKVKLYEKLMPWVVIRGIVSDRTAIQFKMLNKSKGPAMWPRVQSDRMRFAEEWRNDVEGTPNLDFYKKW
jgi:tRNA uridine 5-carboxymethylaminomethyl modification enzyme